MSFNQKELYEFGPFLLNPRERVLSNASAPVAMTPKVFDTLLYLVRNQGRILTKDELLQQIWPDTFVEEVNLAVNISTLRKLLGEGPQDGRYIVTVPGRGYRFVASVQILATANMSLTDENVPRTKRSVSEDANSQSADSPVGDGFSSQIPRLPEPTSHRDTPRRASINRRLRAGIAVALLLVAAIGIDLWRDRRSRTDHLAVDPSIAVLPFVDMSQNKDQEYFADGLTDELTNDLAKIQGLKVIARSSAFQFKGKNEDLRTVGQKLGVANILEGSVRREGTRVRITADLTQAKDGFQLWSETYDRQIDDVLIVQDEIARAVSVALQVRILDSGRQSATAHFHRNPAAYEPYLQAQYFLSRGEDKEDLDKALSYVDQAVKIDPDFAPAWALRSLVVDTAATIGLREHDEGYREAREDAQRAIALDPNSAFGYVALAWVKIGYEWDWQGADEALKKAASLQPGSAEVLSYRAYLYECLGRLDEAIALTKEADALDPLRANAYLGSLLYTAGRYEEGTSAVRKALAINPKLEGSHFTLGLILLAQEHPYEALAEMEVEPGDWQRLTGEALAYHSLNRSHDSDAALAKLIATHAEDSPYQVAEIYAYRDEKDRAFEWLKQAYRKRDPGLNQLKLDPLLNTLRRDTRYLELMNKMKLGG